MSGPPGPRRVVVTGASGNVGTGLLRALAADLPDAEVVGVCRRPPPAVAPYDRVRWYAIDLGDPGAGPALADALAGADAVVHLAWAIQPAGAEAALYRTNVTGTRAVLSAVTAAGVPHLVYASTLGVYAPRRRHPVGEDWPDSGHRGAVYSRQKTTVERMIDHVERAHPDLAVARIRPTLVTQRAAATAIHGLFLGRFVPRAALRALRRGLVPLLPLPRGLALQFVHADDVGDAVVRILRTQGTGAYNLAADALGPRALAALARARPLEVPRAAVRAAVSALHRLGAVAVTPGWFDIATNSPLIDTSRAGTELGWAPRHDSAAAGRELLDGLADGARGDSPALARS